MLASPQAGLRERRRNWISGRVVSLRRKDLDRGGNEVAAAAIQGGVRDGPAGEELHGVSDRPAGLSQGGRRQAVDDGKLGVARRDHREHAGPVVGFGGLDAGVTRNDLANPGQIELVDYGSGFHTHVKMMARMSPKR